MILVAKMNRSRIGSIFGVAGAHADTRLAGLITTYTLLNPHPGPRKGGVTWRREADGYQSAYLSNNVTVAQLSTALGRTLKKRGHQQPLLEESHSIKPKTKPMDRFDRCKYTVSSRSIVRKRSATAVSCLVRSFLATLHAAR